MNSIIGEIYVFLIRICSNEYYLYNVGKIRYVNRIVFIGVFQLLFFRVPHTLYCRFIDLHKEQSID